MSTDPKTLDRCGPDGVCKWLEERTEIAGAGSKGFRHIVTITGWHHVRAVYRRIAA